MKFAFLIAPACLVLAGCISEETASIEAATPQVVQTLSTPRAAGPVSHQVTDYVAPHNVPLPAARPDFGDRPAEVAQEAIEQAAEGTTQVAAAAPAVSSNAPTPELFPARIGFSPSTRTLLAYQEAELGDEPENPNAPLDPQPAQAGQRWRLAYSYVKADCFPENLKAAMNVIAGHFKTDVMVISGFRGNGRRGSLHRSCRAADIRVPGVAPSVLAAFAKTVPGINGVGTYRRSTLTHIDVRATKFAWRY